MGLEDKSDFGRRRMEPEEVSTGGWGRQRTWVGDGECGVCWRSNIESSRRSVNRQGGIKRLGQTMDAQEC